MLDTIAKKYKVLSEKRQASNAAGKTYTKRRNVEEKKNGVAAALGCTLYVRSRTKKGSTSVGNTRHGVWLNKAFTKDLLLGMQGTMLE